MKKVITVLLVVTVQIVHGQDCNTKAANKPSESVRFPDFADNGSKPPVTLVKPINLYLSKAESWIKGILKDFTGARLAYSNSYFFDYSASPFYKATAIKVSYYGQMRFFAHYCNGDKILTEGESGSSIMIFFNDVFQSYGIHGLCMDAGVFTVNGKMTFRVYEKSRSEGRIDFYERMWQSTAADTVYGPKDEYIIIRNSDQPVFLPLTRKEYLQQLLKDAEEYKTRETGYAKAAYTPASEAANKAKFDEELKRIDNSKNYTPEQMAPYRKRFIETWETEKQKFDKRVAKAEADTKETKEVLMEYLKKPGEWLNRSIQYFYPYSSYSGKGMKQYLDELDVFKYSKEEESRTYIASVNPAYYNKSLSAEVPQLIMLHVAKKGYAHMKKVAELIHKPGALKPLEDILNPGKKIVEQPLPVSASNYKLSYLPKLDKLTPLVVPADMKASTTLMMPVTNYVPVTKLNFEVPALSSKLKELPLQPLTAEAYKKYIQELQVKISDALNPPIKKKADDYLADKKLDQSKDIGNAAFSSWIQNSPEASLYLYSKAVMNDPADALTANNFSAFLIMGGLPERSIPILEFWNKQKPGEPTLLANLGNAYYRLGDVTNAMKYLQQCVQKDSLHPTANKILCLVYLKKGDVKKAEEHGTRSVTTCHDEEVVSILRQLNNKIKVGEVMSRLPPLPLKEFPMLQRIKLPVMPSGLDDMEQFTIELNALKESLKMTIDAIATKHPKVSDDVQQRLLMASFKNGLSPIRVKAQYIIMDGLQTYQAEKIKEADVFNYTLKKLNAPHFVKMKAIQKKYDDQLSKLEGGEAGDEDKIQALELAKCKELNAEKQAYLPQLAKLVNQYAQRQEYLSRKFFRDYANWAPYWMPESSASFPSIEADYLKDVLNILSDYKLLSKMDCSPFEPLPAKEGHLQEWEDEYCANFKGKIAIGPVKFFFTCNSWGMDGGEGIVGDFEFKYRNNGAFENLTLSAGLGANWHLGKEGLVKTEAAISVKDFIKIGPDPATGKWVIKDAGVKAEVAGEAGIGNVSVEEKVIEISVAVNAGSEVGGIVPSVFNLK